MLQPHIIAAARFVVEQWMEI